MATIRWLSWLLMICATCRHVISVEVDLSQPLDLVFLIDSSESVTGSNFNKILQFMAEIVEDASVDSGEVRVAVVTFGDTTVIRFGLDEIDNKEELLEFVQETTFDTGNTFIADALLAVRTKVFNTGGDRPEARNVLLIITDGVFDLESSRAMREAETSKEQGIEIYAIGIGLPDVRQLDRLVSKPLENYRFLIESFGYLQEAKSFVFIDQGDDFLDPFGELDGFDPNEGFLTFDGCGNRPMDIVFLVDTSEAYADNNATFLTIRDFLIKFVKLANISSDVTRISLVTYSTSPKVHFRLGEINTPKGVEDAIRSASFWPGDRNLADALDALRRRVFFEYYGDRPQVPDMVILITTGVSNRRVTQSYQYAQALKDIGVNVIGITWSEEGKQELSNVVSEPVYANLFSLDSISELHIMTELVVAQVCESSDDIDLVFLVHFSNALTPENFVKITSFMAELIKGADVDLDSVRVGAAIYRAEGTVLFKLDAYRGDKSGLLDAIRNIKPSYKSADTNLAAGLNLVRNEMFDVSKGDREDVPNGLVIITDANSEPQYYPELEYASALVKDAGVTVFGIGINLQNTDEMNMVSTSPQMSYVLGNVDHLPSMVQELRQKLPSLTFVLPEEIETLPPTTEATVPPTTVPTTPDPTTTLESSREADIAVLFHVGHKTKLRDLNKKLKIYLSNLFAKAKVGPDMLRVALVNYGTATNVLFDFNAHSRKPQVRSAIKTTIKGNLRKSRANLGEALNKIRTELFVQSAGSRIDEGVPAGLIVVTDMVSSNDGFDFEQEMTSLKQMGVTVFGVGVGSSDVHDELRQLTSDPSSDYFQAVTTFSDLLASAAPVKNIVSRVRSMGGQIKRRPTTTTPAVSKYRMVQIALVFRSGYETSPRDYFTHLLPFMARFLDDKLIQGTKVEIAFINYGATVHQLFGFKQISSLDEMQTMILTAPNKLQSKYARFGEVLQHLDLEVFNQTSMSLDTSKHVVFVTDKVYDQVNLKVNNGLVRLRRKGIKYHWVLIGRQSNISTAGDTYLVQDYPSLTDNYDVIDDITTNIALDESEYSEALVPKTASLPSVPGEIQNSTPTKIIIAFRSGSSTSPPEFLTKLLPFISSFIDRNSLSETNTDIAIVNYGKTVQLVYGFQQLSFGEMKDAISGISKKLRSRFSRFPLVIDYINQEMFVPPEVADTDDCHVVFIADQLYEKLDSGIRKGIEHLETRGIHTHWVLIGDNSAVPTTSAAYKVADYDELLQRQDISAGILSAITRGKIYNKDVNEIPRIPEVTTSSRDFNTDNVVVDNTERHVNEIPNTPVVDRDIEPTPGERNVKVVIVFRTGSGTSPQDFFRHLLPFIDSFLFESSAMPEVRMEFSVINYGKTVTKITGFKEFSLDELHGIILGISKKYRSRFARFQNLLDFLKRSVFTPQNISPGDEKHVIFIADKIFDRLDDTIESGIHELETNGVMTHWVTIGTNQTVPTRGHIYTTPNYSGLSDYDVFAANFKILADIFAEPGSRERAVSSTVSTIPTTLPPSTTKEIRYAKIVVVFRTGSSTSPQDYFQHLLPVIDTLVNNVYVDQVEADYAVINYGKSVSQVFGFKDFDKSELQSIIMGMTKKYRTKFSRFQQLLKYLRKSVFIPAHVSDIDEKHVIFVTDKIYDKMDDELIHELGGLEDSGVTTHWVLIGQAQDIPTRGKQYYIEDYPALSDTTDIPVPYRILTDIQYNRQTTPRAVITSTTTTTTTEFPTVGPSNRSDIDPSMADIAFLFHASKKVSKKAFKKGYIKFLIRMIKKCKLDNGKVKAALATYGKGGQLLFNLNTFSQKKTAVKFIKKLPKNLRYKKSDLAKGLRLVRKEIFVAPFDRPRAPNYLVVLTDSPSDNGLSEVMAEAEILKDMGVYIYMIGIGDVGEEMVIVPSEPSTENSKQLSTYTDLAKFKKSGKTIMKKIPALKSKGKKKGQKTTTTIGLTTTPTTTSGGQMSTQQTATLDSTDTFLTSPLSSSVTPKPSTSMDTTTMMTSVFSTASTDLSTDRPARTTDTAIITSSPDQDTTETILSTARPTRRSTDKTKMTSSAEQDTTETLLSTARPTRRTTDRAKMTSSPDQDITHKLLSTARPARTTGKAIMTSSSSHLDLTTMLSSKSEERSTTEEHIFDMTDRVPTSTARGYTPIGIHTSTETAPRPTDKIDTQSTNNILTSESASQEEKLTSEVAYSTTASTSVLSTLEALRTTSTPWTTQVPTARSEVPVASTRFSSASLPEQATRIGETSAVFTKPGSAYGSNVTLDYTTEANTQKSNAGFEEVETTEIISTTANKEMGTSESTTLKEEQKFRSTTEMQQGMSTARTRTDVIPTRRDVIEEDTITTDKDSEDSVTTSSSRYTDDITTVVNKISTETVATVAPVSLSVSEEADIIIAVHSSITATPSQFVGLLEFLAELYEQADIDGGRVQAGVLFYGAASNPIFYLDQFDRWDDVFVTISRTSNALRSNAVDASSAMKTASTMFAAARGGPIPKALIMVTDAASNENADMIAARKEALTDQGVSIYSVGIDLPGKEELELLATASENVFSVIGYEQLPRAAQDIKRKIRSLKSLPERITVLPVTTTDNPQAPEVQTVTPTSESGPIRITFPTPEGELFGDEGVNSLLIPSLPQPQVGSPVLKECSDGRGDILFILDSSTSVGNDNFRKMLDFMKDIVGAAPIDSGHYRVAVLVFNSNVKVTLLLDAIDNKQDLLTYIDNIPYSYGNTHTASALQAMRDTIFIPANGDRSDAPNIAIVLTDGESNINSGRTIPEANAAKREGVEIYGIGIGLMETTEIDGISSEPKNTHSFNVDNFDNLNDMKTDLFSKICIDIPQTTPPPVELEEERPAVTPVPPITTTSSTVACGQSEQDIIFVLDSSTSVGTDNFREVLNFVKDLLSNADIDSGRVRVGALIYSTGVEVRFQLNEFKTKTEVYRAIDNIPYILGNTNTAGGLRVMSSEMFTAQNGDRQGIPNIAFVITDGQSNTDSKHTIPNAELARLSGIEIYAIGIGLLETVELQGISSKPLDKYLYTVDDFSELQGLKKTIFETVCPETPVPTTTAPTTTTTIPPPSLPACVSTEQDIVFVLDSSTSVGDNNFRRIINFVKSFLNVADIDSGSVRVGALTYSSNVQIQFMLNTWKSKNDVFGALDAIPYQYGSTNTADALKTMRSEMFRVFTGDRPDVPNIAIIITDGVSNINSGRTIPEADEAKSAGIKLYALGIGITEQDELRQMASTPLSDYLYTVEDFSELDVLQDNIFNSFCPVPSLTPQPVVTCSGVPQDLIFVLDSSTSVGDGNFQRMLEFVKDILSLADIDSGNVRVGVLIYSSEVEIQFHLNQYSNKYDVFNAIDNVPYILGSTNTADGIMVMRQKMFSFQHGDRPDVRNVAIIVTDGESNINSRRTIPEASEAKLTGIDLYAIGIGLKETDELKGIASRPLQDYLYTVEGFEDLYYLKDRMFESICPETSPSTTTTLRTTTRTTTTELTTTQPVGCSSDDQDIIIILDSSTSVGDENFIKMLEFTQNILKNADIDSGSVRVGVVTYSTSVKVQFHLNKFRTLSDVLNAIEDIPFMPGSTNTADAIKKMHYGMFTAENGDRANVPNTAIIVTDGVSNVNSRRTIPEAELAKDDGIVIYALGIGLTETEELKQISSLPIEEYLFIAEDFTQLDKLEKSLFASLCQESLPEIQPPVACESDEQDIVFVLDSSTSVGSDNFNKMLDFVQEMLWDADIDSGSVRVGVVIYSTDVIVEFYLNTFTTKPELFNAIGNIEYVYGNTNTAGGLATLTTEMFTTRNGDRSTARNIAFVLTDGQSNIDSFNTIPAAERARNAGIEIYAIGIGLTEVDELEGISSRPFTKYLHTVDDFTELEGLKENMFNSICAEVLSTSSTSSTTTHLPTTTTVIPTTPLQGCSSEKQDIVLILDSSTSVGKTNFKKVLDFTKNFLRNADIDGGMVRVGIVTYSSEVVIQFHLNTYSTKADVLSAIDAIDFMPGSTNTAGGLKRMHREMFTPEHGDRLQVQNVAIILTDGVSNINSQETIPEAEASRNDGIDIYALGIGITDTVELEQISSQPLEDFLYTVQDFSDLSVLQEQMFASLCHEPPAVIDVKPVACGSERQDIVFVVDSSTSVGPDNFQKILAFIKDLLLNANIDDGLVRVGTLLYSTDVAIQFHLRTFSSRSDLFFAIDTISYMYGNTNTASGLLALTEIMFTAENGDRPDVPNIAFVITDGQSNINSFQTVPQAVLARTAGIDIYAIGIGLADTEELKGISSLPLEKYFHTVDDFTELQNLKEGMFQSLCPESTTTTPTTTTIATTTPMTTLPQVCSNNQQDIVFVIDSSTSVGRTNFQRMLSFIKDLLTFADIDSGNVRVGAVTFSTGVKIQFHLNSFATKVEVLAAIDNIPFAAGSTNTADAILTMATEMFISSRGDRPQSPNIAFVITDGVSNVNGQRTIPEANSAKAKGINIYAIGIGLLETLELKGISSLPWDEFLFSVDNFEELEGLKETVFQSLCSEPPVPTPPPTASGCGLARVDMVIVIDSSTSVGEANFKKQINFVKQLLSNSDIDSGAVRAGVLIYSTGVEVQFQLNSYQTKSSMFTAIDNIEYIYGSTNTADGLRTMRQEMFTTANGDRPDVMNIAIVITDGISNINSRRTIPEAEAAHRDGIFVYTVGIGLTDTTELDAIATPPASSNSFVVSSFDELEGFEEKVYKSLCPEERTLPTRMPTTTTTTTAKPSTPKPTTPKPTPVPTRVPTTTESTLPPRRTPRPTTPRPTTPRPTTPRPTTPRPTRRPTTPRPTTTTTPRPTRPAKAFDLVVVMDSSVRPEIFGKMTDYVKMVTGQLSIDNEKFRMGLLRFSTYPDVQFQLGNYKTQESVQRAINRVQYRPGETNTAKAFDIVRTQMFKRRSGDRSFARNFILYLTGSDESENKFQSFAAAERAEDDGIQIFTVGFGLKDTSELNEISSHPLSDFQQLFSDGENPRNFNDVLALLEAMPERPPKSRRRPRPPATTPRPRPEGPCTSTGDVVFILDTSGSVGRDNFYRMLNFTWSIVNELEVDNGNYRIGLMTFSDRANREFNLNSYDTKEELKKAISRTAYIYGRTNTADAFLMARRDMFAQQFGDRLDVPNVVVIITDGESNINNMRTIPEAMTLKRAGVTIMTVAVGYADSSAELFGITSNPVRDNLIRVENFDALDLLKDKLITPLCTDINLCHENPCHNGGFCIDGLRSYMCVCTEGYYGDSCQNTCGQPADVVFMLDSSTSIGQSTFQRMKTYAEELVRKMNIESCDIQVGVMKYSSASMVQFNIGTFRDTETISRAIDAIHYTRGQANMASAFATVRENMFNGGNDRPNIRNIAYLLTDGSVEINADTTMQEAELAINSGIRIVPIGIDLRVKTDVENIANVQGGNTIEINGADGLRNGLADQVLRPVFEDMSYCDTNPCSNGGQCRENGNGYVCDCVPGYTGDTCAKRCDAKADVVFVVDTSRYVSRKELRSVKRFLRSVIKRMQFKRHKFRAGIVSFAKYSRVQLTLSKTSKKKSILSIVSGLRSKGAYDPNPAEALRKANLRVLPNSRSRVPRYVVFITKSMRDESNVIKQANKIKMRGVKIMGIGIDLSSSDQEFMKSAVSMPQNKFMHLTDTVDGLSDISDNIMSFLCNDNDPCSDNPCQQRGECVSAHGEYYCKCPRGYAGKHCDIPCPAKADIAFVLDASGSVGAQNFRRVKHFVTKVIDELAIGYDVARVGAVSYSSRSYMGFYMDQYTEKEDIKNAISALGYEYGNTNTAAGLRTARTRILTEKRGDRSNVKNYVVVVTDSISNVNQEKTLPEAQKLKDAGVHVFSVGIGSFDPYELRAMASEPADSNTFVFNDFVSLANFSQTFVRATCVPESVLCDVNKCKNGGVCVPGINSFSCKCPRGYNGPTCEMECITKKDVVFVLDSSSSVGKDNYQTMLDFVKALVEELAGASFNNRFGMIVYSTEVRLIFSLGRYKNAATIGHAVGSTRYYPGSTNTAGGLRTAYEILNNAYGARRDAEDIVILVTDGQSNVNSHDTIPAAEELKGTGARVLTIGIGLTDYSEVAQIASTPEDVFKVSSYNVLHDIKTDILDSSCSTNGYSGK